MASCTIATMRKKLLTLLLTAFLALASLGASDFKFVFGGLDQHSEILFGFLPAYANAGVGYTGLSFIDGRTTELDLLVGGGYLQRKVWQDPSDGSMDYPDEGEKLPIVYDSALVDWVVRFSQGFFASPVEGKDLLTASLSYEGAWEMNMDSLKAGSNRDNHGTKPILPLDDYIGTDYTGSVYPDLKGNRQYLSTLFNFRLRLDMMDDQATHSDGFLATFDVDWAPGALNRALDGTADYYSLTLNMVGSYTLYNHTDENGRHWFSLTLIDRANLNWTDGAEVPVSAQGPISLGRKVRGYNTYTYNTQLTLVNNLDLRFSGPSLAGIFPRVNLFLDMGYGTGKYFNSNQEGDNFLASTGVQVTVSFWDFIDLGYQVAYLFTGDKYTEGPDVRVTGSFTFFLDF